MDLWVGLIDDEGVEPPEWYKENQKQEKEKSDLQKAIERAKGEDDESIEWSINFLNKIKKCLK